MFQGQFEAQTGGVTLKNHHLIHETGWETPRLPFKSIEEIKIQVAFQQVRRLIMVRSPDGAMCF